MFWLHKINKNKLPSYRNLTIIFLWVLVSQRWEAMSCYPDSTRYLIGSDKIMNSHLSSANPQRKWLSSSDMLLLGCSLFLFIDLVNSKHDQFVIGAGIKNRLLQPWKMIELISLPSLVLYIHTKISVEPFHLFRNGTKL